MTDISFASVVFEVTLAHFFSALVDFLLQLDIFHFDDEHVAWIPNLKL